MADKMGCLENPNSGWRIVANSERRIVPNSERRIVQIVKQQSVSVEELSADS